MHDPRYIQVEDDVYIDTKGGLTPQQRAWITKIITYGIGLVMLGYVILMVFTIGRAPRGMAERASCQNNLKQLGIASIQYLQDNDNRYPSVEQRYGWAIAFYPYVKSHETYHCPSVNGNPSISPYEAGYTDYWYNRNLSRSPLKMVDNQGYTFLLGDGIEGNARANLRAFPASWQGDETSPLWRHLDGANYAFADGHVKWLAGKRICAPGQIYHFGLK